MYGYVVSDLVPEVLHERIEHVIVLLDRIFRFPENILSKSNPCENGELETVQSAVALRLTNLLGLRIIFDETGTFTSLLRNLSKDSVHWRHFATHLVLCLCYEAIHFR
jgi:hypothetical protein